MLMIMSEQYGNINVNYINQISIINKKDYGLSCPLHMSSTLIKKIARSFTYIFAINAARWLVGQTTLNVTNLYPEVYDWC